MIAENKIKKHEELSSDIRRLVHSIDFNKMQRMENFLEQLPFPAFIKDKENRIVDCNEALVILTSSSYPGLKITKSSILGWGWQKNESFNSEAIKKYLDNDLDVIETGKVKKIIEAMPSNPTKLLTYKIPFYQRGEIVGIIGFSMDITELLSGLLNG